MRFPFSFVRYKGATPAGAKALGSDAVPADGDGAQEQDNVFEFSTVDEHGNPIKRFFFYSTGPYDGTNGPNLSLYAWDEAARVWVDMSSLLDTAGITTAKSMAAQTTVPSPPQSAARGSTASKSQCGRSVRFCVVLGNGGITPDGKYTFYFAPSA